MVSGLGISAGRVARIGGIATAIALAGPAAGQSSNLDQFRRAATEALGGAAATIEFTASGWDACLGQAWAVTEGWARWELTGYRRVIDYATGTSTQTAMRRSRQRFATARASPSSCRSG